MPVEINANVRRAHLTVGRCARARQGLHPVDWCGQTAVTVHTPDLLPHTQARARAHTHAETQALSTLEKGSGSED